MLYEKINKDDEDIVFVYTTCGSVKEARDIGFLAIEEKLAISADYWEMNSIYPWQNVIQEASQYMLVLTTEKIISSKLISFIESILSLQNGCSTFYVFFHSIF